METLEQAYRSALAVLTAPVSFLEWTTLKVDHPHPPDPWKNDSDWNPVGLSMGTRPAYWQWDVVREIEGERYIYVFCRSVWMTGEPPTLVEELKLASDGTIFAAQMGTRLFPDRRRLDDPSHSPLPDKRRWNEIGPTMRFVRRLRGSPMAHYFFASRIPLSRGFVEELRHKVAFWVPETQFDDITYVEPTTSDPNAPPPPTTFGEWDPNVFTGLGPGALQVPVLDPITILLHLHDLAVSATDDVLDYATIDPGQSKKAKERRERVDKRAKKLVLAYVVQVVLKNYRASKHAVSERTNKFIRQYWEQINYRTRESDRWWKYLGNWYQSDPIEFLSRAHREHPKRDWESFFLPTVLCLLEANCSQAGRAMLKAVVKDEKRFDWLHKQVLPGLDYGSDEDTWAEGYQPYRKVLLLPVLEAVHELTPHFLDRSTEAMWRVLGAHSKHFHVRFMIDGASMDPDPLKAAAQFKKSQKLLSIEVPKPEEIVGEWHELAEEEWHELAEHGYKGKVLKLVEVVELIDLTLSVRQFLIKRSVDHGLNLVRSMADTSTLLVEFFKHGVKEELLLKSLTRWRFGLMGLSGLVEMWLGVRDTSEAAERDDATGVAAGVVKTAGAAIWTTGAVSVWGLGMLGVELSFTPFFYVGLVLMGIGAFIGFFQDEPMDTFLSHCAFGDHEGGGGELVAGLEVMKKGEYLQQLEVLLNLLCRFTMDLFSIDPRAARVTMGWVPDGATLVVDYADSWRLGTGPSGRDIETRTFHFGKGGVQLTEHREFDLMMTKAPPPDFSGLEQRAGVIRYEHHFEASFAAQLHVAFGDFKFVVPTTPLEFTIAWTYLVR